MFFFSPFFFFSFFFFFFFFGLTAIISDMIALLIAVLVSLASADYAVQSSVVSHDNSAQTVTDTAVLTAPSGGGGFLITSAPSYASIAWRVVRDCNGAPGGATGPCSDLLNWDVSSPTITIDTDPAAQLINCALSQVPPMMQANLECDIDAAAATDPSNVVVTAALTFAYPGCCPDCVEQPRVNTFWGGVAGTDCAGNCFNVNRQVEFQYPICGQE